MVGTFRLAAITTLCILAGMVSAPAARAAILSPVPVRITIPTASTSASVIAVGVTPTGHLDTPHNFVQAGWYMQGTVPGNPGSAVIDGHVDNGASVPGIFKHLQNVKPGDDIFITRADGKILHFVITTTAVYPYTAFPSASIFASSSTALLKIITCHGTYLPSKGTYSDRLVVTAVLAA